MIWLRMQANPMNTPDLSGGGRLALRDSRGSWSRSLLALASGVAWYLYLFGLLKLEPIEFVRSAAGMLLLWLPCGILLYAILRRQVEDRPALLALSAIGSFALTTVHYVAWATLAYVLNWHSPDIAFGIGSVAAGIAGAVLVYRARCANVSAMKASVMGIDWLLVLLIAASGIATSRYQRAFAPPSANGDIRYVADGDQAYYVSQACELSRGTPPIEMSIRAGYRERAYHNLPHVTAMLIARYAGQHNLLRAHFLYEYTIILVLMSMAASSIARVVTGSRGAGYIAVALLYIFAIPTPVLLQNGIGFFYCTLLPQATSTVEPTLLTSPQMYSGILVGFGVFLTVALISVRLHRREPVSAGVAVLGMLLVAALIRFRLQMFLVFLPAYTLILLIAWWRSPRWMYVWTTAIGLLLCLGLYLEMKLPVYLPQTSKLLIGNNQLTLSPTASWMQAWPGMDTLLAGCARILGDGVAKSWGWQVVCLFMFAVFNVIGLPATLVVAAHMATRRARREALMLTLFILSVSLAAILAAPSLATTYDAYSIGGQMPLHLGWYVLPALAMGLWQVARLLLSRISLPTVVCPAIFLAVVAVATIHQLARGPSSLESRGIANGVSFSRDEWSALAYIRDCLPGDAVVMTPQYCMAPTAIFSGLGQRRAYLEYYPGLGHDPQIAADADLRVRRIIETWTAQLRYTAQTILAETSATHLIEYSSQPMAVQDRSFLVQEWTSQNGQVTIWRIRR